LTFPRLVRDAYLEVMNEQTSCDPRQTRSPQRGGIAQVGPNKFRLRWTAGRDPDTGKPIRRKRVVHGTKRDAQRELTSELARVDAGKPPTPTRTTVGDVIDDYFENWSVSLTPKTRRGYEDTLRRYLPKHLRRKAIRKLSSSDLQAIINRMVERGLSPSSIHGFRAVVRLILNRALKSELIDRNPACYLVLPKRLKVEQRVLGAEQVRRFLAAADGHRLEALFVVLVSAGLRPSEAFALLWTDLAGRNLTVSRSLARYRGQSWTFKPTKTSTTRVIELPEVAVEALEFHRTRQKRARLEAGDAWEEHGLMFPGSSGSPLDLANVRKAFHALLRSAGLPRIRLYDLRHTAATLRIASGTHARVVQEVLGHSSITLTMDTYGHVIEGMQRESAEKLDALLRG